MKQQRGRKGGGSPLRENGVSALGRDSISTPEGHKRFHATHVFVAL